jgi:hypothetical protein
MKLGSWKKRTSVGHRAGDLPGPPLPENKLSVVVSAYNKKAVVGFTNAPEAIRLLEGYKSGPRNT